MAQGELQPPNQPAGPRGAIHPGLPRSWDEVLENLRVLGEVEIRFARCIAELGDDEAAPEGAEPLSGTSAQQVSA